ncbi:MAG: ABC transporter ATP-binding protein [Alphaproteobacteria bacterium]|nr:ABC transporter ATP-binding protein [Alphaproteobacteria bacterium]
MSDQFVLRLNGVTKRFGAVTAVDSVELKVARGEFLTLLGPSGSGKTTVLMMIAGFESPDAGEIWIDGRPQSGVLAHRRRNGIVFQNYALFPHLSVFENVAFGLRNLGWTAPDIAARVAELLRLVRLEGTEARRPAQLSGGQQQRVALARALAFRPSLLLLDEPLGALDRKLREHMLTEFQRIHRTLGTTMLFVTHDQEEALAMSDRVAVMDRGRIVQIGRPGELYERPATQFVADFLGDANLLPAVAGAGNRARLDNGIDVECPHDLPPDTPATLLIRPEKIALGPGPNAWPGRVESRLYFGQTTRYTVRTSWGASIQVRVLNRHDAAAYGPGADVTLSWQPESGRVLRQSR